MNVESIRKVTDEMLKKFVNCLGLDGDYYVSLSKTPICYGSADEACHSITPRSSELKKILLRLNIDDKYKRYFYDTGLILINHDMKDTRDSKAINDLLIKVIHERLHANRVILLNSQYSGNRAINGVLFDDDRFVKHNFEDGEHYEDSSQGILKASIDDSPVTVEKYSKLSDSEKAQMSEDDTEYHYQMEQQRKVDEALVETMAIIANRLYVKKTDDIMAIVKDINEKFDGDIKAITGIILRHNDLELFKWMIDPIGYEVGVANYDFFGHYITEDDLGDLNDLMESEDTMFDDDEMDRRIIEERKKNSL